MIDFIKCFPSVTGCYDGNGLSASRNYYVDLIICKWEFNMIGYNDTSSKASTDCSSAGTNYTLDSKTKFQCFQQMIEQW